VQPLLQWKSNKYYIFWVCVFSFRYPACNARAQYRHLWLAWRYSIFPLYIIYGTTLEERLLNIKCVFWFYLQPLSEIFIILRRSERDMIKNVYWPSCNCPLFLSDVNETWIFPKDFRKTLKYQILWKSVQWESSFTMRKDGRTDGQTDSTKLIVALWTRLKWFIFVTKNSWCVCVVVWWRCSVLWHSIWNWSTYLRIVMDRLCFNGCVLQI